LLQDVRIRSAIGKITQTAHCSFNFGSSTVVLNEQSTEQLVLSQQWLFMA